jgi:hypothetical protein
VETSTCDIDLAKHGCQFTGLDQHRNLCTQMNPARLFPTPESRSTRSLITARHCGLLMITASRSFSDNWFESRMKAGEDRVHMSVSGMLTRRHAHSSLMPRSEQ